MVGLTALWPGEATPLRYARPPEPPLSLPPLDGRLKTTPTDTTRSSKREAWMRGSYASRSSSATRGRRRCGD
jgi:hypothetical protein